MRDGRVCVVCTGRGALFGDAGRGAGGGREILHIEFRVYSLAYNSKPAKLALKPCVTEQLLHIV